MSLDPADYQEHVQAAGILVESFSRNPPSPGVLLVLFDFQEALGMSGEALDTLLELARSVREDTHFRYAPLVRALLLLHAGSDTDLNAELERIKTFSRENRRRLLLQEGMSIDDRKVHQFDLARELLLANRLQKNRLINDEEYLRILADLCDIASSTSPTPSTVLHAIADRGMRCHEKVLEYLVEQSGLPYVNLALFQTPPEVMEWLPAMFSRHRAALVFGAAGPDALVAVLNPFNLRLRKDLHGHLNRDVHFYLTHANAYNERMKTLTGDF